jgi:hypothetical protein
MARILFGNIVSDARGKIGGIVYSRNTGGAYARQKVSPVQPRTASQLAQRENLGLLTKNWARLTQGQRESWKAFSLTHKRVDVFRLAKQRTAQQMYMFLNLALLSNGLNLLVDPPVDLKVAGLTALTLANGSSGVVQSIAVTAAGSGYTTVPTVGFTGGGGSGATAVAVLRPTSVGGTTGLAGGTGYTTAPTVTIAGGGGTGATATATVVSGAVTAVAITAGGSGYTSVPTAVFSGGGGSGASVNLTLTGVGVASVSVTAGGTAYTSAPAVTFTGGGGTYAAATATVVNGTTALSLIFAPNTDANTWLEVWATPGLSAGRQFVRNLLRKIGTFGPGLTSPLDLTYSWQQVFGDFPDAPPFRIAVEANMISQINGARSVRARADLLVVS